MRKSLQGKLGIMLVVFIASFATKPPISELSKKDGSDVEMAARSGDVGKLRELLSPKNIISDADRYNIIFNAVANDCHSEAYGNIEYYLGLIKEENERDKMSGYVNKLSLKQWGEIFCRYRKEFDALNAEYRSKSKGALFLESSVDLRRRNRGRLSPFPFFSIE